MSRRPSRVTLAPARVPCPLKDMGADVTLAAMRQRARRKRRAAHNAKTPTATAPTESSATTSTEHKQTPTAPQQSEKCSTKPKRNEPTNDHHQILCPRHPSTPRLQTTYRRRPHDRNVQKRRPLARTHRHHRPQRHDRTRAQPLFGGPTAITIRIHPAATQISAEKLDTRRHQTPRHRQTMPAAVLDAITMAPSFATTRKSPNSASL